MTKSSLVSYPRTYRLFHFGVLFQGYVIQWRHHLNPKNYSESIYHPLCKFFEDMCSTILPQIAQNFSKLLSMSTVTL